MGTTSSRPAPDMSGPTVTFNICWKGGEKKVFRIHKSYITKYSAVFRRAFDDPLNKGELQEMDIEDVHPFVFNLFSCWCYSQTLHTPCDNTMDNFRLLVGFWIFACTYQVPKLQEDLMQPMCDIIFESKDFDLSLSTFWRHIYAKTAADDPLRLAIADRFANSYGSIPNFELLPPDMVHDIQKSLHKRALGPITLAPVDTFQYSRKINVLQN